MNEGISRERQQPGRREPEKFKTDRHVTGLGPLYIITAPHCQIIYVDSDRSEESDAEMSIVGPLDVDWSNNVHDSSTALNTL